MKKKTLMRSISLLLILCMAVSILPLNAFATNTGSPDPLAMLQQEPQNSFTDVSKSDWFFDAVTYAKENGIFSGTGQGSFSPGGSMTRAMYLTVLGRMAGVDVSKYRSTAFSDVTAASWYAPYVAWAVEQGITVGVGNGLFSPDMPITREELATLTVRYFESYHIPYSTTVQNTSQPKDIATISPWAQDSVLKLWQAGLLKGDSQGNFIPGSNATRAEGAVLSTRTNEIVKTWVLNTNPLPTLAEQLANSGGTHSKNTYKVNFETNGGGTIASLSLSEGTTLNNLPTPYKMNTVFLGWYKDRDFERLVSDSDTLAGDMTLYAKYAASGALNETQSIPSVSKLDQAKNFTIEVDDSTATLTAEQVKAAMTLASQSNPDFAGIEVTGSGGHFTVAAQGGAFEEGGTYTLTLNDQNLSFTGEDKSTTTYTFTIARQQVMNLGLNEGMVYIPASEVWDMTQNGASVSSLSVPLAAVSNSGTDLSTVDLKSGTFTYSGGTIKVGDSVAIYEGIRPDQRNLSTSDADAGTVAYLNITAINGNTYTYGNADSKEVLFTPDILPVSDTADTDGDPNDHSITVSKSTLNFSDSNYAQMGLNANTTVDEGDFVSFYTGTLGDSSSRNAGFGKITGVSISGNNYIIAYTDATQNQVMAAMDFYNQKYLDGEKLLANTDIAAMESQIEQQALASGFVDESSKYLAALALDTDSFKKMSSDFDLKSYRVELADGKAITDDQVMLMAGNSVKVENKTIHARLSTQLEHFAGLSGVRCVLEVGCDIVIDAGESNEIVIHVTGTFEQEVRIKVGASGGAVWKYKWIFPYIADYRINATIDAYTYTGIRVNASIGTFEKDAEWDWADSSKVQNIGKQIKELMDKKDQYLGDGINTVAGTLSDKYSQMLENDSDWIDLFDKEIYSMESFIDPFHILVYGVKVSFVVSAKMNISIGCDFYYENAKRYIFAIGLFSKKKSNDTVNLVEEHYQFTFYVMGTLGLRAGIRLEVSVGLISLKLDSVGFVGEVGAYVQLWGYFYYELSYFDSSGITSKYSGAMYLEFGIYLEISFKAQVFDGTFEYNPTLYENQWPLLFAGAQNNILDFSYSLSDTPKVSMAKLTKSFVLPDSTFSMNYMDMKTGKTDNKTYDTSKDYTVQMTNKDFQYDPTINTVTVTPGTKLLEDGKMTITWNGSPLAFTSIPISRTIPLHWENLRSAYSISFNSNGGSAVGAISLPYNTAITAPTAPKKLGYVFGGWYKDQNFTQSYTIPAKMPAEDIVLYAKWTPATNTKYIVEHHQQNLINDLYTLADTHTLMGTTGASATPVIKTYAGFAVPAAQTATIKADGSTVVRYYYTRNKYTLTFDPNSGTGGSTAQVKYGANLAAPIATKSGYTLSGWTPAVAATMPAENTTYTAQWTVSSGTAYRVEHYQQNVTDAFYTLAEIETLSGTTNTGATAVAKSYPGFAYDSSIPGTKASGSIAGDGSLVLKQYYTRNSYTLTFDGNGGTGGSTEQVKYGANLAAPIATKSGYTLSGWTPAVAATMRAEDTTYTAQWTANSETAYRVEHYQQNVTDAFYTLAETETLSGTTNTQAAAVAKSYLGFAYDSSIPGTIASGSIAGDGSLVLKQYYTRNSYTLTFDANGGTGGSTEQVKYGAEIAAPIVTNPGYPLSSWTPAVAATMPAEDTTYTAQWTASGNMVSTLDELITALADNSITEVTVTQAIDLPNGTLLDGLGKTVRAAITGIGEDDSIQVGSAHNIFNIADASTVTIQNLTVKGGSYSAITNAGTLTMNGVTITQSGGPSIGGGGLQNTGKVVLKDCVITKNVADFGAGFLNSGSSAIMIMEDSSVIANSSLRGGGGGENNSYATLYLNNSTLANNMSSEIGGAINNYYGTVYVLNSTITGNMVNTEFTGVCGGGIGNNGGTLYVVNSLLTNNFEQHSSYDPKPSDIGVYSNGSEIHLYNSYCGAYVTDVIDYLAVTGDPDPANVTNSTVNPGGNGLNGIFDSYVLWSFLDCPALVKQANGTHTAPLALGSIAMSGGCDVYFDYSPSGVTILGYGSTPDYLIGSSGGTKITGYQGGSARTPGVIGAFEN